MSSKTVVVRPCKSKTVWPLRRAQKYYWHAKSSVNGQKLARSSDMYTNLGDCVAEMHILFDGATNVSIVDTIK